LPLEVGLGGFLQQDFFRVNLLRIGGSHRFVDCPSRAAYRIGANTSGLRGYLQHNFARLMRCAS
jgi:hypothetical protein